MAYPDRIGCLSLGANTRTLYVRDKIEKPHPATGVPVLVSPPISMVFPGTHPLFLSVADLKRYYGFETMKAFVAWLKSRGEVENQQIIFSAVLNEKVLPVAVLGNDDVEQELRRRMMLGEKEEVGGTVEEKRAALLKLREVAGEMVAEPKVRTPEPVVVADKDEEAASLSDEILSRYAGR